MGFLAGYFKDKAPTPILALSLLVGHLLNLIVFILFGLFDVGLIVTGLFWGGLLYEVFIGIVAVMIIKGIYTLGSVQ